MKFLITLSIILISSVFSFADDSAHAAILANIDSISMMPENETMRYEFVDSLIRNGFTQISGISLTKLRQEIAKLQFFKNTGEPLVGYPHDRNSAVYFRDENKIIVNVQVLKNVEARLVNHLLIHEMLGALGYPDVNYEYSSLFVVSYYVGDLAEGFLTAPGPIKEKYGRWLRNWKRYVDNLGLTVWGPGGGTTIVGGGGAIQSMLLKVNLLYALVVESTPYEILEEYKPENLKYIREVISLRVEVDMKDQYTAHTIVLKELNGLKYLWIPKDMSFMYRDEQGQYPNEIQYLLENVLFPH